jgi:hypothetical protein
MFQICEWPLELIICFLDFLENEFGEVNEAMFQGFKGYSKSYSVSWSWKKATLTKLLKWFFKYSKGPENS